MTPSGRAVAPALQTSYDAAALVSSRRCLSNRRRRNHTGGFDPPTGPLQLRRALLRPFPSGVSSVGSLGTLEDAIAG